MPTTSPVDLASPAFQANRHAFYARLRAESPVYRTTVRVTTRKVAWLIARYDDVVTVLKDGRFVKDAKNAGPARVRCGYPARCDR
jgi:cytochrome P450